MSFSVSYKVFVYVKVKNDKVRTQVSSSPPQETPKLLKHHISPYLHNVKAIAR